MIIACIVGKAAPMTMVSKMKMMKKSSMVQTPTKTAAMNVGASNSTCLKGYELKDGKCKDIDECLSATQKHFCAPHLYCVNTEVSLYSLHSNPIPLKCGACHHYDQVIDPLVYYVIDLS